MALQLISLLCLIEIHFMNKTFGKVALCKHQVKMA